MGLGVCVIPEWAVRSLPVVRARNLLHRLVGGGASGRVGLQAGEGFEGLGACGQELVGGKMVMCRIVPGEICCEFSGRIYVYVVNNEDYD